MSAHANILLLDDDEAFLETYREMLTKHLMSMPEVRTARTGSRALAMLDAEPFTVLCLDLNLPKMDGLQVIAVARRKHPQLRIVVLTGIRDEQYRTRAYALGVDQYWIKPESDQELGLFMESLELMLNSEGQGGFRGVQSKSLVDIIQLECMSQSSTLLRITNGHVEGKIWIHQGEVIDAEAIDLKGEAAFQRIMGWKAGNFELLPSDPDHPRTITTSYQGLLLNTAQAIDEAASLEPTEDEARAGAPSASNAARLAELSHMSGVEFALIVGESETHPGDTWGLENAGPMSAWTRKTLSGFQELGERLQLGQLHHIVGVGPQRKVSLAMRGTSRICIGYPASLPADDLRDTMKCIFAKWDF